MATDSSVTLNTMSGGDTVDTVTVGSDKRQVIVIGDPTTTNAYATVSNTNGVLVDIARIAAGDNNIGNVDIVSGVITTVSAVTAITNELPAGTQIIGSTKRDVVGYTKFWKYVSLSGTSETTIWTPTSGKKFVITDIHISVTAAGTCTLRDNTAGTTLMIFSFAANGGVVSNLQTPIQSSTNNNVLTAQASVITQYIGIAGYEV